MTASKNQLPGLKVTPEQEARATAMAATMEMNYWGLRSAACAIVSLQDEIERLSKPAHEREPPHCSSCSCGMDAIAAAVDERMDRVERELAEDLTFVEEASGLIELLESDFGQSGADVRYEAIRCELVAAFNRGKRAAQPPRDEQ